MSKSGLLARQKAERELWTIKVIAYTEQQTLDAVCLALAGGKYYSPREVRYDIKIVTRDGKQHKL